MKQRLFSITALVFLLLSGIGSGRAMAAAITIPTAEGTFVDWNNATGNGFGVENGGANVGSTGASTVITFDVVNPTAGDYMISFKTGTKNEAKLCVSLTDQTGNTMVEKTVDVVNTNSWTPSTQHNISVMQLSAGNYTLQLKVTETTGKYAGNYGDLAITSLADFDKTPVQYRWPRACIAAARPKTTTPMWAISPTDAPPHTPFCVPRRAYTS